MELFVNYSTLPSCKYDLLNYFTIGTLKWCMKCTVVDVFSVACSPERRKERDVSHVYRQWKMIVLLWLPSNRSESFVFLLIFPVSASMPLIPRDCAIIKYSKSYYSINSAYKSLFVAFLYIHRSVIRHSYCYSICYWYCHYNIKY